MSFKDFVKGYNPLIDRDFNTKLHLEKTEITADMLEELDDDIVIAKQSFNESEDFVKIFTRPEANISTHLLDVASISTIRLFSYILQRRLVTNKDIIYLNYEIYQEDIKNTKLLELSIKDYQRAVKQLRELNVLYKKSTHVYAINPNLFFKGNRLKLMANLERDYKQFKDNQKNGKK